MTGYISNSYQQIGPQTYPQFAGATKSVAEAGSAEPTLMQQVCSPFQLLFLPLTLQDEAVRKYVKASAQNKGVVVSKDPNHKVFGHSYLPKFDTTNEAAKGTFESRLSGFSTEVKGIDFKGIGNRSLASLHSNETLYKSLRKEGHDANKIFEIVHGSQSLSAAEQATKMGEISKVVAEVKPSNSILTKAAKALGTGTFGKVLRGVPGSTLFFGLFEIPSLFSASKYGVGEIAKQVGRSALNIAGSALAFTAGTEAGAAVGSAIGTVICPGVGTLVGGAIGGLLGGTVASFATEKVTKAIGNGIFGKPKAEIEEEQKKQLAQQQQQVAQVQPQNFGAYSMPQMQPSFSGKISLGDEDMLSNSMSAYKMYQGFAA